MNSPSDIQALCKQAKRAVRHGEHSAAIDLFRQVLEVDPDNLEAHTGIATAAYLTKQFETAVEHFTRAGQLDPKQGKASINLGAVYNRMGEYQKAVDVLRKGLQKERDSFEGYYNMGLAQWKLKQNAMAVSAYREAVRLNPENHEAHQHLACVYLDMGNYDQAVTHFQKALEIKPDFKLARAGLKKAEEAAERTKPQINPFGRLIEERGVEFDSTPELDHELTEEEREADRRTVNGLAREIEKHAKDYLAFFAGQFEPALARVTRAAIDVAEKPYLVEEASEEFHEHCRLADEYRKNLVERIEKLREYEETMTAK